MAATVLEGRALTRVYRMGDVEVPALRGVDVALHEGELVVVLGVSGSGKSTLLNILGGLDVPTSGEVLYRGTPLDFAREEALTGFRRRHVGFVFQFFNLVPSLTARENVELAAALCDASFDAREVLGLVGLAERADHFPSQLSGGEQQRVAIARAVAKRPDILLCDEPTGALDFRTGQKVLSVLQRVNRELGTTTVLITHAAAVAAMAHRVLTMADGRIRASTENAHPRPAEELRW